MDRRREHHRGDGNGNVELASGDGDMAERDAARSSADRVVCRSEAGERRRQGQLATQWRPGTRFVVGNLGVNMVYAAKADIDEVRIYNRALTAGEVASFTTRSSIKDRADATANINAGCPAPVMPSGD